MYRCLAIVRDLQFLGGKVLDVYSEYENATVLIDRGGMGLRYVNS